MTAAAPPDIEEPRHKTELLRFTTAGSVDDGKSTLIGRLLYDSKQIFEDQWQALERSADLTGGGKVNLANLTDGLRAEREQGITIDVAYRYFSTPKRKFIIADTPGHIQYTRNMVTGASTANLAVILIDARQGVTEQTRRHAYLSSLLRIPHMLICVNKMDLVDFDRSVFESIRDDFNDFSTRIQVRDINMIPISALRGDNVVDRSARTPWYQGPTVLSFLEELHIANDRNLHDARLPVQYVIRPQSDAYHDFRGYAGQIASGSFRVGDPIVVLPSGLRSRISRIYTYDGDLETAFTPMSVTLCFEDDIDVSRGDLIVRPDNVPFIDQHLDAMVCWMHDRPMKIGGKYQIKHTSQTIRAVIKELKFQVDIRTLERVYDQSKLGLNEIGRVTFTTQRPVAYDAYSRNRHTGSFILIELGTNLTVGAGLICEPIKETPLIPTEHDYVI
jgi:sulfate adenylyltransferase large subunit